MVGEVGLEPTKLKAADLQSAPFATRDTPPYFYTMKTEGYTLPPAGVTAFRPYARGRAKKYLQKRVWLRIAGYCQSLTPRQGTLTRRKAGFWRPIAGRALSPAPLLYKRPMRPHRPGRPQRPQPPKNRGKAEKTAPAPSPAPMPATGHRRSSHSAPQWLYGLHAVEAALANPRRKLGRAVLTPRATETLGSKLLSRVRVETAEPSAIDRLLPPGAVHQGAALEAWPLKPRDLDEILARPVEGRRLVLVLDQLSDPH